MAESNLQTNRAPESRQPGFKMDVKIERELGKGAFGTVYSLNIKSPNQKRHKLALKLIERSAPSEEQRESMLREMEIMRDLNHEHIVKYYAGYLHNNDKILLLLEFCAGTDLYGYLMTFKPSNFLSQPEVYKFGSQIASAIVYLHKKHIIHRDIKPQNILLTKDNHVKLADFGLSRQLENTIAQAESFCGTRNYMAPEIHNHQKYSYTADSWSFGCVLYVLMFLNNAFDQNGQRIKQFHTLPHRYNKNLHDLVESLFIVDVDKRLNMNDAFSFFQKIRNGTTDILPPEPEIPILPDRKSVMGAIRKYNIACNQSTDSEDDTQNTEIKKGATNILPPTQEIPISPDKKAVMSAIKQNHIKCNKSSGLENPNPDSEDYFNEYPEDYFNEYPEDYFNEDPEPEDYFNEDSDPDLFFDEEPDLDLFFDEEPDLEHYFNEDPDPEQYLDEEPDPELFLDEEPDPEQYFDEEPDPEQYLEEEPDPEQYLDEEPDPEQYLDEEPDPEQYLDEEPDPEQYLDEEPDPEQYLDEEPDPEQYSDEEPDPEQYSDEEPDPEQYLDEEPDPEQYLDEEPDPEQYLDEEPDPEQYMDEEPDPEQYLDEEPDPEQYLDEEPDPEQYLDEHPDPESYFEEQPDPEQYLDEHPDPDPADLESYYDQQNDMDRSGFEDLDDF